MKRSRTVSLAVMGLSAFTMTACDEPVDAAVYRSVEQCIADGVFTAEKCQSEFDAAAARHPSVAPRYSSRRDCEADFGYDRCSQSNSGGTFIPFMAGYMMGTTTSNQPVSTQPLYRSSDDPSNYRTAGNSRISGVVGRTTVSSRSVDAPRVSSRTVARGGFGARASRSGFGG